MSVTSNNIAKGIIRGIFENIVKGSSIDSSFSMLDGFEISLQMKRQIFEEKAERKHQYIAEIKSLDNGNFEVKLTPITCKTGVDVIREMSQDEINQHYRFVKNLD